MASWCHLFCKHHSLWSIMATNFLNSLPGLQIWFLCNCKLLSMNETSCRFHPLSFSSGYNFPFLSESGLGGINNFSHFLSCIIQIVSFLFSSIFIWFHIVICSRKFAWVGMEWYSSIYAAKCVETSSGMFLSIHRIWTLVLLDENFKKDFQVKFYPAINEISK